MMATALASPSDPLPDHVRVVAKLDSLAGIADPAVTLALAPRPPLTIGSLLGFADLAFTAPVESVAARVRQGLAAGRPRGWHDALATDVAALATVYGRILRSDAVAVRLDRVTGNACWRFHADYVTIRLITTYKGRGTEWLDQAAARELADGGMPPTPRRLAAGTVGLFKGWLLAPETAIVHRSPPIAETGEERLLLVIDPPRGAVD